MTRVAKALLLLTGRYALFFLAMLSLTTASAVIVLTVVLPLVQNGEHELKSLTELVLHLFVLHSIFATIIVVVGGPMAFVFGYPVWILAWLILRSIGLRSSITAAITSVPTAWAGIAGMLIVFHNRSFDLAEIANLSDWLFTLIIVVCATILSPLVAFRMFPDHG